MKEDNPTDRPFDQIFLTEKGNVIKFSSYCRKCNSAHTNVITFNGNDYYQCVKCGSIRPIFEIIN